MPLRLWSVAALLTGALSCASVPSVGQARPDPLAAMLDREIAAQDAVPWSDRLLSWSDFQGAPPAAIGNRGAETAYTLFHAARCTGDRFEYRVVTALRPKNSWVAAFVQKDTDLSTRTLRHEQTHFDLAEVHARRLRRHFADLYDPCRSGELDTAAARFLQDEVAAQQRYDEETSYGRLQERQIGWDADVARQLLALERYGDGRRGAAMTDVRTTRR